MLRATITILVALSAIAAERPSFTIDKSHPYDASKVRAYPGKHENVYRYIDGHYDEHVAQLQRWIRQRSISAQNDGIREMAALLRDDLKRIGFQEAEIAETSGHPGVFGYFDAGAK